MLYILELLTRAGELECVRFVGQKRGEGYVLLNGGIETPIFPRDISQDRLREKYEQLLNIILQEQGFSLADLLGGQEIVEEFWDIPDIVQQSRELHGEWQIPLDQCAILSSHSCQ